MDLLAHIRTFLNIVDRGSLAAAAKADGIAPSAVTASLQRLEAHVGATLILRSTRRLSLTAQGERFLSQGRRILAEIDDAVEQVREEGPLRGTIRLTSINDFGRSHLSGLIDSFQALHPQVRFELSLEDDVVDLVDSGFDLAIRTGPLADSRLTARLIQRGGRSVCASPVYWARHGKPKRPEDLAYHNCLFLARPGAPQSTWRFREGRRTLGVRVSGNRTANDGGLLRQWAIDGAGVVLKSDYDIRADIAARRLETVLEDYRGDDVNLFAVHASGRGLSRRAHAFIDHLAKALGTAD